MKNKKYLILIMIVILIYGVLLIRGYWKQNVSSDLQAKDFMVSEEKILSNASEADGTEFNDLWVQIDENIVVTEEKEETSEAEEALTNIAIDNVENKDETEKTTVLGEEMPSKTPTKETETVTSKPGVTPESKPAQEPTITPESKPSREPTITPESKPSLEPTITPESKPSQEPTTTPESKPSLEPTTTPESKPSQEPTTTPESKPSQEPTTTPESTPEASKPSEEPSKELVKQGEYDLRVIPDKFNTGCKNVGSMMKINEGMVVDGIEYVLGDNGATVVVDLYYRNKELPDEIVIKNVDFSGKKFALRNVDKVTGKKIFTFENCKFDEVMFATQSSEVTTYFTNCSFRRYYGSNSTFYNCAFGGSVTDGMNPFRNVYVYDSYFSDFDHDNLSGVHTDAIQIYGKENIDVENILFSNCRVEIPIIDGGKNTKINACFAVGLEYSSGRNLLFENCFINGGGFSIYAGASHGFTIENTIFSNVSVGGDRLYGNLYPKINPTVVLNNVRDTDALYVASVWKDGAGKVNLSVTNDTAQDRYLVVETTSGRQEFMVPCKKTVEQTYRNNKGRAPYFSELSIDVEVIPEAVNPDWIICYDKYGETEKQIRFVNWSGKDVYR